MPTLNISGHRVRVGDEFMSLPLDQQNAAVDEIAKTLGQGQQDAAPVGQQEQPQMQPQPAKPPSMLMDAIKSAGTGLAKGAIGIAGFPGDLSNIASGTSDYIASMLMSPEKYQRGKAMIEASKSGLRQPSTSDIQSNVEGITGEFYKPQTTAGEYAQTIGEFAPGMAMGGGTGSLTRRVMTNVVAPAVTSETAGQATKGTAFEPYARVAGAMAGGMIPSIVERAMTPLPMSADRKALVDVLMGHGVQPTAGQATGSKALQYAESTLGDAPFAGGRASAATERAGEQFTDAVSRSFGGAGRATAENIDNAFSRIGGEMDSLAARHAMPGDKTFLSSLKGTVDDYNAIVAAPNRVPAVDHYLSEVSNALVKNGGTIPGDVYQSLRSRLEKAARSIGYNSPGGVEAQEALRGIKGALDDAVERGIASSGSKADLGAWRTARQEYRNLLDVSRASTGAGEGAASGLVSPQQMRSVLTRNEAGRRAYARGNGDLAELTRAGNVVLAPLPQSGTAPRVMAQSVAPAIAAGTTAMFSGFPVTGATMIAGAAAPGLAGRAVMNPRVQSYLANQRFSGGSLDNKTRAAIANAILGRQLPALEPGQGQ